MNVAQYQRCLLFTKIEIGSLESYDLVLWNLMMKYILGAEVRAHRLEVDQPNWR